MSKVLKNGITVLVVAVCGFVCLIALLLYASGELKYASYELESAVKPELVSATAERIDSEALKNVRDDRDYYKVNLMLQNNSNYGYWDSSLYFTYKKPDNSNAYIQEMEHTSAFDRWQDGRYFPAGKAAVSERIIEVDKDCREVKISQRGDDTDPVTVQLEK